MLSNKYLGPLNFWIGALLAPHPHPLLTPPESFGSRLACIAWQEGFKAENYAGQGAHCSYIIGNEAWQRCPTVGFESSSDRYSLEILTVRPTSQVDDMCNMLLEPEVPHALRLQGILCAGVAIVFQRQQDYLLHDCQDMVRGRSRPPALLYILGHFVAIRWLLFSISPVE